MNMSETGQADSLEFAGNMLERHDMYEYSAPGLLEVTGVAQHGMATGSGLNDYDYQNLSSLSMGLKNLTQLETVNKIPIPPEIMEHFKHIKCHCMMGLFPEIGRAWLTIDSDIYIWTYEQTRDVAYFDGLSHLIVSVGLVAPKPGVFISDVKYLLILTTPIEIVILGVTFGDSSKSIASPNRSICSSMEEMQLMNKPIFVLNTDNVAITTIEGTSDGRIFLGGRDGCLYEICYQAESNWFGKRCKKVNHSQSMMSYMVPGIFKVFSDNDSISKITVDNSRHLLYVLTEKGAIEAWDLGEDSNSMRRIARISQNDIATQAGNILRTIDTSVFKPVTALCPLTLDDSPNFHLIAISQTGVRFYFSTVQLILGQQNAPYEIQRPQGLYLLHVRLPPGYTPNTTVGKPRQVHSAFYSQGSLLMISTPQPDQDLLWSLSSEPFPYRQYLAESSTVMPLDGQVWAIAEVKQKNLTIETPLKTAQRQKKVVMLTNQGVHVVSLLKSVDLLHQLLKECHGPHNEAVKAYFQVQTEPQACATSLLLACMEPFKGTELGDWAAQAFLLYGGEPHFGQHFVGQSAAARPLSFSPPSANFIESQPGGARMYMSTPFSASRPASSVQQSLMQQTQYPSTNLSSSMNQSFNNTMADPSNLNYSAKHTGLYLHMSRLLRTVWRKRCIDQKLNSSITQQDCAQILEDLYAIRKFLESNTLTNLAGLVNKMNSSIHNHPSNLHNNPYGQYSHQGMVGGGGGQQKSSADEAQAEEKKSLDALVRLIKHSCEVIALWKILSEHQFHLLIAQLTKEQQSILQMCTFRDLILARSDICGLLIITLINSYLNDNASVGSISSKLRDVCPNLYRHEDAVSHKATEILLLSKNCTDVDEKDERLRTALQLCKSAAPNLPLSSICQQFTVSGFYQGVIELSSICAAKIDPNEAAVHFYKNNEPVEDQEGYMAFSNRMKCYKEIKIMLEHIYQNVVNSNTSTGYPTPVDENKLVNNQVIRVIALALQSQDSLLHTAVYEWLLSHNLLGELLEISEPLLGDFLARSVKRTPENLILADLLWKYHERNGQHAAASKILDKLANMQSESMSLQQRIEYLARAVMCMRSDTVGFSAHNGVLLKDLEDKLEVAQVQKQVLDAMSSGVDSRIDKREAVLNLNSNLYSLTVLYSDFAERFNLWDCKLTILNCSHHNDPLLIESVWTQILDKELEYPASSSTEKCRRLLSKVQCLAQEYESSGHCFPLPFIVKELELRCFRLRLVNSPVPEALIAMNLDLDAIFNIYSRLISMNGREWASEEDELYLVRTTSTLLSIVASQPNIIPAKDRRKVVAKSQDLISACLNNLYTKPKTQQLIDSLRETQAKLQRIIV